MTTLDALSQAWVTAEASLPLSWQLTGLMRFGGEWVALAEGPEFDDYLSGTGQYADPTTMRRSCAIPCCPSPGVESGLP